MRAVQARDVTLVIDSLKMPSCVVCTQGSAAMNQTEVRYRVVAALLQAEGPLTLRELGVRCETPENEVGITLGELISDQLVIEGSLLPETAATQYRWATRWRREAEARSTDSQRKLQSAVGSATAAQGATVDVDDESALAFHHHVIHEYKPPGDKRSVVFLQCSVRRPFSASPSHASMRRAVSTATGYDPRHDFANCPVHVVVLASGIGPVPYELENVRPANIRASGVKHLDAAAYGRVGLILAERMAQYITVHRGSYDRMASFTEGRYAEVMRAAMSRAAVDFVVLPTSGGPRITRLGSSIPLRYWEKYWIQLYMEIVGWLPPPMRERAEARLAAMDVEFE